MKNEMSRELRNHIGETYDGGCWEPASSKLFDSEGEGTQIFVFERDVEFEGVDWRCLIVSRDTYDPDSPEDLLESEDLMAIAWPL